MLQFNTTKNYTNKIKSIGFKIILENSLYKTYTKELDFIMNIGYKTFSLRLFWGKAKLAPEYSFINSLIPQVSKLVCYDDEETVLLRQNKIYTLRKVTFKNIGNGLLCPYVSLMELDEKFDYPINRFMEQNSEEYYE